MKKKTPTLFLLLSIVLFVIYSALFVALFQENESHNLLRQKNYKQAIINILPYKYILRKSESFNALISSSLFELGMYEESVVGFLEATKYSGNPDLFQKISFCYFKMGDFSKSIYFGTIATNIAPNRIYPKYSLMKIYIAHDKYDPAFQLAQKILEINAHGNADEIENYKSEARELLTNDF